MTTRFNVEGFVGAVILKEFTFDPDGNSYTIYQGTVSIVEDKAMLGFPVSDRETNWIARIEGPSHSYNFPGCQVRGVITGLLDPVSTNVKVVR